MQLAFSRVAEINRHRGKRWPLPVHPQQPRVTSRPVLPDRGAYAGWARSLEPPGYFCQCPHSRTNTGQTSTILSKRPVGPDRWHLSVTFTAKAMLRVYFCGQLGRQTKINAKANDEISPVAGAPQPLKAPE